MDYSTIEVVSVFDINYEGVLKLCKKCRINFMVQSNSHKILDSLFYESNVPYTATKSKENRNCY